MITIVHAADLHVDSPMRGLARLQEAPGEAVKGATRKALQNLVELTLREKASLLLIAGDIFDGDWRDYNTGLFVHAQLSRLTSAGVHVVMIRGNHDAASQITRNLRWPDGVIELPSKHPETVRLSGLRVAVHGQSYAVRDVRDDLAAAYPPSEPGMLNIGLLHTALSGREGHDTYAPASEQTLTNKGYQYWALGHVHTPEVVSDDPWIVFPGNIQGRSVREVGSRGCAVLRASDERIVELERHDLDVLRWEVLTVDAAAHDTPERIVAEVKRELANKVSAAGGRQLVVRVHVAGATAAHDAISREAKRWQAEVKAAGVEVSSDVIVEKVLLRTRPERGLSADAVGAMADVQRTIERLRHRPQELEELAAALKGLADALPSEYFDLDDAVNPADAFELAELLGEVETLLGSRFATSDEEPS